MTTKTEASTIYLVRHSECKANVQDMNLPPEIDVITEKGLLQASLLGKQLQDVTFTQTYESSYSRALDTANEILKQVKTEKPKIKVDERIREREMGEFENRPIKHLFEALFKAARKDGTKMIEFEVPGGELVQEFQGRITSFLEDILNLIRESSKPQTILVVTHGVVIMRIMLMLRFWSKDTSKALTFNPFNMKTATTPIKNTAYHLLSVKASAESTEIEITKIHESGHLDPLKPKVPVPPTKDLMEIMETFEELRAQQCTFV